ncbi:hypothetical protein CCAX7_35370 [Capsulimonas corticalis]|uniref:Helix-turn-helix domain-containing protein n=1 Tax=Capsulimonas corticalis TaxID=2219043 RepID=A0A9N7L4I0_9BACT|nr:hypothetical protein [Capsulimonas corticalis]BDI31486.1 hypothetical protein CCAX7_35370 [Capsulimonas corticalis]
MDSSETQSQSAWETAPFVVEHLRLDRKPDGSFRPAASILMTPALRTSGLLASLPAEEVKSLIFLLSFVTPNGRCLPSVQEMALAMGVSENKMRARMNRLTDTQWLGKALVHEIKRPTGMDAYALSPEILAEAPWQPDDMQNLQVEPDGRLVHSVRDAIVAHSRERYTKPRADVEREIAEFYGWRRSEYAEKEETSEIAAKADPQRDDLRRRLFAVGVGGSQAEELLDAYPADQIHRQLDWLPYRNARNRSGLLLAAIEQDYAEPRAMRT